MCFYGVLLMIPSITSTFMAMTSANANESAAFLKDMRDKTLTLVEKALDADMLNPEKL